jgi:hypothetical protein
MIPSRPHSNIEPFGKPENPGENRAKPDPEDMVQVNEALPAGYRKKLTCAERLDAARQWFAL